jgi:hypothetical protein
LWIHQILSATSAASEVKPAASWACFSVGKLSSRQYKGPDGSSVSFFSTTGLMKNLFSSDNVAEAISPKADREIISAPIRRTLRDRSCMVGPPGDASLAARSTVSAIFYNQVTLGDAPPSSLALSRHWRWPQEAKISLLECRGEVTSGNGAVDGKHLTRPHINAVPPSIAFRIAYSTTV